MENYYLPYLIIRLNWENIILTDHKLYKINDYLHRNYNRRRKMWLWYVN